MGSAKSPQEIAGECVRRAKQVKSEGDREQLIQISRRLTGEKSDERPGPAIGIALPDDPEKRSH